MHEERMKVLAVVFFALSLVAIYVLGGCASTKSPTEVKQIAPINLQDTIKAKVATETDEFTGETTTSLVGNMAPNPNGAALPFVIFDMAYLNPTVVILFSAVGLDNWIFVDHVDLIVDGERFPNLEGKASRDVGSRTVTERLAVGIDAVLAMKIANAKSVKFRMSGSKGSITRELSPDNIANVKKFMDAVGGGSSEEEQPPTEAPSPTPNPT